MSRYADYAKDDLAFEIDRFLKDHPISELLNVVADCVSIVEPVEEERQAET